MSDTPRTDARVKRMIDNNHSPEGLEYWARDLERELAAANQWIEFLRSAIAKSQDDITQICGKALNYPWFKDDQKNFPGATEQTGVCVGEHVAETIVAELADKYAKANERIKRMEEAGDRMTTWLRYDAREGSKELSALRQWNAAKKAKP